MQKHRFLCCNQETYEPLIWEQYGYWHYDKRNKRLYPPPEWFTKECIAKAKHLAKHVKEPNLQIEITITYNPKGYFSDNGAKPYGADWKLFDSNNPHIEPDAGGVVGCKSEEAARAYAMRRYHELKRLYDGDVEALLVYQQTGIACLPNWNHNDIDSWGFKEVNGKIVKTRVPRASEVIQEA